MATEPFNRVVEILASDVCTTGFCSQATLPVALHVSRESRQVVDAFYITCFGSFLQPERVRVNLELDMLYLDMSQEEEGLHHFFEILKEFELARLKYVAVNEGYLVESVIHLHLVKASLALTAMTSLREMIVVRDITIRDRTITVLPAQTSLILRIKQVELRRISLLTSMNLLKVWMQCDEHDDMDIFVLSKIDKTRSCYALSIDFFI